MSNKFPFLYKRIAVSASVFPVSKKTADGIPEEKFYSYALEQISEILDRLGEHIEHKRIEAAKTYLLNLKVQVSRFSLIRNDGIILKYIDCFSHYLNTSLPNSLKLEIFCYLKKLALSNLPQKGTLANSEFSDAKKLIFHAISEYKKIYLINVNRHSNTDERFSCCRIIHVLTVSEMLLEAQFEFMKDSTRNQKKAQQLIAIVGKLVKAVNGDLPSISWLLTKGALAVAKQIKEARMERLKSKLFTVEAFNQIVLSSEELSGEQGQSIINTIVGIFEKLRNNIKSENDWLVLYSCIDVLLNLGLRFNDLDINQHAQIQDNLVKFIKAQLPFKTDLLRRTKKNKLIKFYVETCLLETIAQLYQHTKFQDIKSSCSTLLEKIKKNDIELEKPYPHFFCNEPNRFLTNTQIQDFRWLRLSNQLLHQTLETTPDILILIRKVFATKEFNDAIQYIQNELLFSETREIIFRFATDNNVNRGKNYLDCFCLILMAEAQRAVPEDEITTIDSKSVPDELKYFHADDPEPYGEMLSPRLSVSTPPRSMAKDEIDYKIESIMALIQEGARKNEVVNGRDLILIIGDTASGKSTTINWLSGCKMVDRPSPLDEAELSIMVDEKSDIAEIFSIGHENESETIIPQSVLLDDICLCDAPGFMDSRGPDLNIATAVNIINIIRAARSVRLLLLINNASIKSARAGVAKTSVEILNQMFGSFELRKRCTPSILVGLTRRANLKLNSSLQRTINKIFSAEEKDTSKRSASISRKDLLLDEEKQIILIDPLEREGNISHNALLRQILSMPSLDCSMLTLRAALRAQDEVSLAEIAKKIVQRIDMFWEQENIFGMLDAFLTFETLSCIPNPIVAEKIQDVQETMAKHLHEFCHNIVLTVKSNETRIRVTLKKRMRLLKEIASLTERLKPWIPEIESLISSTEKSVKTEEARQQEAINNVIMQQLSSLIKFLNLAIDEIADREAYRLVELDHTLNLCDQIKIFCEYAKRLSLIFIEMDKEDLVRIKKYFFRNQHSLESLKRAKSQEVENIILAKVCRAKIKHAKTSLTRALATLTDEIPAVVKKSNVHIAVEPLTLLKFPGIHQYGFSRSQVEQIKNTEQTLQSLIELHKDASEVIDFLADEIRGFLEKVNREARDERITNLSITIREYLKSKFTDTDILILNQSFAELNRLNNNAYSQLKLEANTLLITRYIERRDTIRSKWPNGYLDYLDTCFVQFDIARSLESCFQEAEIASAQNAFQEFFQKHEAEQIEIECDHFTQSFTNLFDILPPEIDKIIGFHFEEILPSIDSANPSNDFLQCLAHFESNIPNYLEQVCCLERKIEDFDQRYRYQGKDRLLTIQHDTNQTMMQLLINKIEKIKRQNNDICFRKKFEMLRHMLLKDLTQPVLLHDNLSLIELSTIPQYTALISELQQLLEMIAPDSVLHQSAIDFCQRILRQVVISAKKVQSGNFRAEINHILEQIAAQKRILGNSDLFARYNKLLPQLKILNLEIYKQIIEQTRQKFLLDPQKLIAFTIDNWPAHYVPNINQVILRFKAASQLKACFNETDIHTMDLEHNKLMDHENRCLEQERYEFEEQSKRISHQLQIAMDAFMEKHFSHISCNSIDFTSPEKCLTDLARIEPALEGFLKMLEELNYKVRSFGDRYMFIQKTNGFEKMCLDILKARIDKEIIRILETKMSSLLILKTEDVCKKAIETLIQLAIQHNERYYNELMQLNFSLEQTIERIHALKSISQFRNCVESILESVIYLKRDRTKSDAAWGSIKQTLGEINQKAICRKITVMCNRESFGENLDILPRLCQRLKDLNPLEYATRMGDIQIKVEQMQDAGIIDSCIRAKSYHVLFNNHKLLNELYEKLNIHLCIDLTVFNSRIDYAFQRLFRQAINDIKSQETSGNFLEIDSLRDFIDVERALSEGIDFKSNYPIKLLITEAQQIFITSFKTRLSPDKFARYFMKCFSVAKELSMERIFKKDMHKILSAYSVEYKNEIGQVFLNYAPDLIIGAIAVEIIDKFTEFRRINTVLYNKKASNVSFEDALHALDRFKQTDEKLECMPDSGEHLKLMTTYDEYHRIYETLVKSIIATHSFSKEQKVERYNPDQMIQETKRIAESLKKHRHNLSKKPKEVASLLAHIFAHWSYLDAESYFFTGDRNTLLQPQNTQILGILCLIGIVDPGQKNNLIQIKTGEGKSICLGVCAILYALLGFKVDVVCYSGYLSNRDSKAFSDLFDAFSVRFQIDYHTIYDLTESMMYRYLPDFRDMVCSFLKDEKIARGHNKQEENVLLIDEVDVFFGEGFYGKLHRPGLTINNDATRELMRYIWAQRKNLSRNKETVDNILSLPCCQTILKEYPRLDFLLPDEIDDMLRVVKSYFSTPGISRYECVCKDDKIGKIDVASGEVCYSYCSYPTAFSYLHHRDKGDISTDEVVDRHLSLSITAGQICFSELPNLFDLKLGMTGTLEVLSDAENKILSEYNFIHRSLIPSTFKKKDLKISPAEVYSGERTAEYFDAIKSEMESILREGKTILVIFETYEIMEDFFKDLRTKKITHSKYREPEMLHEKLTNREREAVVSRAIAPYKITLMTRTYGRGTDFKCLSTALQQAGGVHVLVTFYPEMESEEIQIEGRTCRQDDVGSYKKILFGQDLVKQQLLSTRSHDGTNIPDLNEFEEAKAESWDDFLQQKRIVLDEQRMKRLKDSRASALEQHTTTLKLSKLLQDNNPANIEEIQRILTRLNT